LLAAAEAQGAFVGNEAVEVDGKVFVGTEVVDDRAALLAVDHGGVEGSLVAREVESP
jgi:hypothetical protein